MSKLRGPAGGQVQALSPGTYFAKQADAWCVYRSTQDQGYPCHSLCTHENLRFDTIVLATDDDAARETVVDGGHCGST